MDGTSNKHSTGVLIAAAVLAAIAGGAAVYSLRFVPSIPQTRLVNEKSEKADSQEKEKRDKTAYDQLVGNTPMIKLGNLSKLLKRHIYLKIESANPSGSGKDRAVQAMLDDFESQGLLKPGMHVVEGSSGSTGIALAYQCRARGYRLHIVMPDDQAEEKRNLLRTLGATVHITQNCAISNKEHYVHKAKKLAEELGGVFINQFENLSNMQVHYKVTGPEILQQIKRLIRKDASIQQQNRRRAIIQSPKHQSISSMMQQPTTLPLDAFVMSSGTGGTIAGISKFFKEVSPEIQVVLADPHGSSLCSKVNYNVCYTKQQAERTLRRHRYDSIVEGVGLDRVTANFDTAQIDLAYQLPDQELLDLARWIMKHEGLMVGSSTALNLATTLRHSLTLPEDSVLVTMGCDQASRHLSRFWNPEYVGRYQLIWRPEDEINNSIIERITADQQARMKST